MQTKANSEISLQNEILFDRVCFYVAYSVYLFSTVVMRTAFGEYSVLSSDVFGSACQGLVLCLLFLKMILQRAEIREWLLSFLLVCVGFICWRQSDEGWLFWIAIFVVCGKGINIKTLAWISFIEISFLTCLIVFLSQVNIIDDIVFIRGGEIRHSLGFKHPNYVGMYLLSISMSFSIIHFEKNPLPDLLILIISFFVNIYFVNSRSSALLCLVQAALLLVMYNTRQKSSRKFLMKSLFIGTILIVFMSIYFMLFYNPANSVHRYLNSLLTGRLFLAHEYYEMAGLSLFGNNFVGYPAIYWDNGSPISFMVDNAIAHLLLRYGIIPSLIFLLGLMAAIYRLVRDESWGYLIFGLSLMVLYGFSETLGIKIECNYLLVCLGPLVLFSSDNSFDENKLRLPHTCFKDV